MQNDEKSRTSSQGPDGSSIENEAHEQTRMTTKSKECSFSPLLVSLLTTVKTRNMKLFLKILNVDFETHYPTHVMKWLSDAYKFRNLGTFGIYCLLPISISLNTWWR